MKKMLSLLLALVFTLALTACGSEAAPETTAAPASAETAVPGMGWTMDATAWSSPNGATVNLSYTPSSYAEGDSAAFIVRLEGEEAANVPCIYADGTFTASADLNAADGYCYYVLMTTADGNTEEIPVNTPSAPFDESLINLADALNAYCTVTVNASELKGGKLAITDGTAQLQLPKLTLREGAISCQEAVLILSYDDQEVAREALSGLEADESGLCSIDLSGLSFPVPGEMEDDHRLSLRLDATLSDGQAITAPGGAWHYFDGGLVLAVG